MSLLEIRQSQRLAKDKNLKIGENYLFASQQTKCTRCGIVPKNPAGLFYKLSFSPLYKAQDDRGCICKDCMESVYKEYVDESRTKLEALRKFCCALGYYYEEELARSLYNAGGFTIAKYVVQVTRQFKGMSIYDNLKAVPTASTKDEEPTKKFDAEKNWTIEDRKNKQNVCNAIGYDPFASGTYSDEQLRFLYNTTAAYLTDGMEENPNTLQSVILLVKDFMQLDKLDQLMNEELNSPNPDESKMSSLTTMKDKLSATITRLSNENGLSAKTSGKSAQGSNTLSSKMQQMIEAGFSLSKVNLHDIKMQESFREIAQMNAQAIINEMNLTGDDYARICADQRKFVSELQEKNDQVEEENRLLHIRIKELESAMKKK